jgi:NAD(P)H-dependent FMN reductase
MHVLGVVGSLKARSGNRLLLEAAARAAPPGSALTLYDGLRALPWFDPDLEVEGPVPVVDALRRAVAAADAVWFTCPEYGHSLPGALKNAVDWLIGSGELERKRCAITAAVPHPDRGLRGLAALATTLGAVSAEIVFDRPIVHGPSLGGDVAAVWEALLAERVDDGDTP